MNNNLLIGSVLLFLTHRAFIFFFGADAGLQCTGRWGDEFELQVFFSSGTTRSYRVSNPLLLLMTGKCNRGLSVVDSYKLLKGVDVLSEEEMFLASTLGWCIEWVIPRLSVLLR